MFHRKHLRLVTVTTIVLLLTVASTSLAAAHSPLSDDIRRTPPPIPGNNGNDGSSNPPPGGGGAPPATGGGGTPSTGGGGVSPPATENGLIRPVIYPWPPPNAIVLHAATPIQLSQAGTGLRVYFIARNGNSTIGPFFDEFGILAHNYPNDPVTLYTGSNPGTGKPVTIDYLPAQNKLRISTFYADRPPHDIDKPYVFTVDANHSVNHEQW